jgi:peptide/nickel transport system permease protein
MSQAMIFTFFKFIFSLLILTLTAHFILVNLPGNPSAQFFTADEYSSASAEQDESIKQTLQNRGLLLPDFYFSIHSAALPALYFQTFNKEEKRNIKQMAYYFGNAEAIEKFIIRLKQSASLFTTDSARVILRQMLTDYVSTSCNSILFLNKMVKQNPGNSSLKLLYQLQTEMHKNRKPLKKYIPVITFHPRNRFHEFLAGSEENAKGIIHGNLGTSWQTRMPVSHLLASGYRWTFFLATIALIISLSLSLFIGIKAGSSPGSGFDKISSFLLFVFYSIPVFWLAVMLLFLFSNPHVCNLFPPSGVLQAASSSGKGLEKLLTVLPHLVLPLICFVLPSMAWMARTLRAATVDVMQQPFIRTAKAKGLSKKSILFKHVFRNILLQVITIFSLAWPALLSGSVIIESVFSIPGAGLLTLQAVQNQDYPVLAGLFLTSGAITLATFALSDFLYRLADPRLKT